MYPKDAAGIANRVDRSSLIWVCTVCPNLSVRKLRIIKVALRAFGSGGLENLKHILGSSERKTCTRIINYAYGYPLWHRAEIGLDIKVYDIDRIPHLFAVRLCKRHTVMILRFRTDRSGQTVQTLIRLLGWLQQIFGCRSFMIFTV